MAQAFLIEIPNFSAEQGAAVLRELGLQDLPPAGQLLHIEGPAENGMMRIVDVWESQEMFETFVQEQLAGAFRRAGLTLPADLRPTAVWPVSAVLK